MFYQDLLPKLKLRENRQGFLQSSEGSPHFSEGSQTDHLQKVHCMLHELHTLFNLNVKYN